MKETRKNDSSAIYSKAFKRIVVTEFESGLFTKAILKRRYGISSNRTIDSWLKK